MVSTRSASLYFTFVTSALCSQHPDVIDPKAFANATTTSAAATTSRPWYLNEFSREFVSEAVEIRSSGVPVEQASSAASHLAQGALEPPQFTSLASKALDVWVSDGLYVNATSLYDIATDAKSAYESIHKDLGYWSYVNYARSVSPLFDLASLAPPVITSRRSGEAAKRAKEIRALETSIYSSLVSDPLGKAAIETLSSVGNAYYRDFSFSNNATLSTGFIENFLANFLS